MSKASQLRERTQKAGEALQAKKAAKDLVVDKDKVKAAYNKDIISLEIIKTPEHFKTVEEAEEYYQARVEHRTYLIDDLDTPYMVRLSFTEKKKEISSVDPEHLPEQDEFELSESIQDILRENLFPVIKSNFPEQKDQQDQNQNKNNDDYDHLDGDNDEPA